MIATFQVNIEWPAEVPLPSFAFQGVVRNASIQSSVEHGYVDRRSRFTLAYGSLGVQWTLNPEQCYAFQEFFETTLGNGTACFSIPLRYPLNSALSNWMVRFIGGYEAEQDDRFWRVSADLDLVSPVSDDSAPPAPAPVLGWVPFLVASEESSGTEEFTTAGGEPYYVGE